jgi:glycosyltransferase involved in cell wall biosynthesis
MSRHSKPIHSDEPRKAAASVRRLNVQRPLLSVVVPVFNEEDALSPFVLEMRQMRLAIAERYGMELEVIFVDDGSRDDTRRFILGLIQNEEAEQEESWLRLVALSRNFGKEVALTAGIRSARGEAVVPIDVDLQDPPGVILELIETWRRERVSVVQAIRADRSEDGVLKRSTAAAFYWLMGKISSIPIQSNAGDFQLMDRRAVDALLSYGEQSRFMKGLTASVGFQRASVTYTRARRSAGKSKFSPWKLWNFALEGITAFSTAPLRVWTYLGTGIAVVALVLACWTVVRTLVFGVVTPGYASLMTALLFLGGVQLIGIGVIGEYVGRIATEVRRRPLYHVEQLAGFGEESKEI